MSCHTALRRCADGKPTEVPFEYQGQVAGEASGTGGHVLIGYSVFTKA